MSRSKENIIYEDNAELIAKFAKALAHPTRIAILQYLVKQTSCFNGDLVDIFPIAQSTISQHLKELKNVGLIHGELNPPKIRYCINQENWEKASELLGNFFQPICITNSCKT